MYNPANKGKGKAFAWIVAHVAYKGDDCLLWPFSRHPTGYGTLGHNGETFYAHRKMCELVNGPPPTPNHYATHSCGKGHDGCVHPEHLVWKTPTENQLDAVVHGTARKPGLPRRKLTDGQVAEIRALEGQMTKRDIAARFGVRWETISQIHRGVAHLPPKKKPGEPPRRISDDERTALVPRAQELRAGGLSLYNIGLELGVSRLTARVLVNGGQWPERA